MSNVKEESLKKHYEWHGKIETKVRVPVNSKQDLMLAYTPGVAEPCMQIHQDVSKSFELTRRWNTVPVITDGTAVLGLGDIGPEAGMPVMEGKCALFKAFGNVDAFPICIKSKDTDEIINTIKLISGSFGGINLEDISAPRCFEIERRLKEELDIPVFHDDQHGTAIVTLAALINALKLVDKKIDEIKIVINGAGSAGIAIAKHLLSLGVGNILMVDLCGILTSGETYENPAHNEIASRTNKNKKTGKLADAVKGADVFIGVSKAGLLTQDMVKKMAKDAIVLAMANPTPEIYPDEAKAAGARVVCTGRSDFPNQVNNLLAFPGIFRGALDVRATDVNEEMKIAAAYAIASLVSEDELNEEHVITTPFDERVAPTVAAAVAKAAQDSGIARNKNITPEQVAQHTKELLANL